MQVRRLVAPLEKNGFAQDYDMIQAFPAHRADEPFDMFSWRSSRTRLWISAGRAKQLVPRRWRRPRQDDELLPEVEKPTSA